MIFVFNGDADGICALQQVYLAERPIQPPVLITGVKRDTHLIKHICNLKSTAVTVFDIEIGKNRAPLEQILTQGCTVRWFDHHKGKTGTAPTHHNLQAMIDTSPNINTSEIVNKFLNEQYPLWAAVGLYGDNIHEQANEICLRQGLSKVDIALLTELGQSINYNSYGLRVEDLYIHPSDLWKRLAKYSNPLDFLKQDTIWHELSHRRQQDLAKALQLHISSTATLVLPNQDWAHRVMGEVGHYLAHQDPSKAHCVAVDNGNNGYTISIRASLESPQGAAEFCSQFDSGGGRAGAAGINHLPKELFNEFKNLFKAAFY